MKFSEILKELRTDRNLTHKELAEKTGYSKAIIGFWENEKNQPTADAIITLSKFFGVSTDYLLGIDEYGTKTKPTEPQKIWLRPAAKSGQKILLHVTEEERREMFEELEKGTEPNPEEII